MSPFIFHQTATLTHGRHHGGTQGEKVRCVCLCLRVYVCLCLRVAVFVSLSLSFFLYTSLPFFIQPLFFSRFVIRARLDLGEITPHNVKQLKLINQMIFPVSYSEKVSMGLCVCVCVSVCLSLSPPLSLCLPLSLRQCSYSEPHQPPPPPPSGFVNCI